LQALRFLRELFSLSKVCYTFRYVTPRG
jgi:hypothetical protein